MNTLILNGQARKLSEVEDVALAGCRVEVAPQALRRVAESRGLIQSILAAGDTVYGVNTGFGKLADVRIPGDKLAELQINLVRSHAGGVGNPLAEEEAREFKGEYYPVARPVAHHDDQEHEPTTKH